VGQLKQVTREDLPNVVDLVGEEVTRDVRRRDGIVLEAVQILGEA